VVHRDIKPDNVLLAGGAAVITDFGIAKALAAESPAGGAPLTQEGMTIGTPGYMAPEQVAGDPSTDHRADIYAFGVLAYEMLTGHTPFHDLTPHEMLTAQMTRPAPAITAVREGLPGGLASLVMRCLATRPADRPASAADLIGALDDPDVVSGLRTAPGRRPASAGGGRRRLALAGAALVVVVGGALALLVRGGAADAPPRSVAVMPLANATGDSATAYLADGLTDEITLALSRLPGVRVAAHSATAGYRGRTVSPREVGRTLQVATLLEGSVQVSGGRLRLVAQLTDARDGLSLWSQRFEGDVSDVFALQDSLAAAVADALRSRFGGVPLTAPRGEAGTSDVAAYDLFLRGRYQFRRRSPDALRQAADLFQQAIARDSGYARAYAGLADVYAVLPLYTGMDADSARVMALDYVERAVALDSTLADAIASRGGLFMALWRWKDAEQDLQHALALDSSNVNAWQWYGEWLLYNGRAAEAVTALQRAAALDPTSSLVASLEALALSTARRPAEALAAANRSVTLDSTLPVAYLMRGAVLAYAGRAAEALPDLARARRMAPEVPNVVGMLGYALGKSGRTAQAEALRDSMLGKASSPGATSVLARVSLGLGDTAQALSWLEWAVGARDPIFSSEPLAAPIWDPVRRSPRFASVVERAGLSNAVLR